MSLAISVSIIMPIYNAADYIQASLNSIISQTYKNFDIILVDDCGNDDSILIAKSFLDKQHFYRYSILHHDVNQGPSQARNTGLSFSSSDYVLFVDSDDILHLNSLEVLVTALKESRYDFVTAGYWEKYAESIKTITCDDRKILGNVADYFSEGYMNVMPWNKLCRRQFLIDNNLYFEPSVKIHEDYIWTFKLSCKAQSARILPEPTYVYNVRAESLMTSLTISKDLSCYIVALEHMVSFVKAEGRTKNSAEYIILEGKKSGIIYSLLQMGEYTLFNECYPVLKNLVYISPLTAYKERMINVKYLIRDLHYCLPTWLGKIYKLSFYMLYYKLMKKPIVGAIWG